MSNRRGTKPPADLSGKRVTVVGLGRFGGGVGAVRWLVGQGARVTVSDKADSSELSDSLDQISGLNIAVHLGGHDQGDFLEADLLVVNPAVPKDLPLLKAAQAKGVPRTSEINLFMERCFAPVVGITGSVGKSTTAAMTGEILSRKYTTHLGGNIGRSLLDQLPSIAPDHVVVLELSSFQLEDLPIIGLSPHVAVVTNLQQNHLDRHGTMDAYAEAKKNIFAFQTKRDVLILNAASEPLAAWAAEASGRVEFFDPQAEPFELSIPGDHNQANAQAAWSVAQHFNVDRKTAASALSRFSGLPHRLERVVERNGVRYYNDSKCTTPDGAIVALESFPPQRAVIIVGGYDKGVSFDALGERLIQRAKAVIAIGATAGKIIQAVEKYRRGEMPHVEHANSLASAVALAEDLASQGDVVLLSPACASYDMFTNYEHRGRSFVELIKQQ